MIEYVFGSMVANRNKGEDKGALSCVGGLFRLGFAKLLHEHVETSNLFHPQCSQETATLPLLLMVYVVKMLLPCVFFPLSSSPSSHSPPPFLTLVCLLACLARAPLPRIFTPVFCLFTSSRTQGVCVFFFSLNVCVCVCVFYTF